MAQGARYLVTIRCIGLPPEHGEQTAKDITEGFRSRPWHSPAICEWDGKDLILRVENDFDNDRRASSDQFSHEICAKARGGSGGNFAKVAARITE
jgi:hypothetical protein